MSSMKTSSDIREDFLRYFESKGHQRVASSSLVPGNDPTLLFTNAGMVQFKDVFLGQDSRPYTRAASSQRCVRAGGKHNDLENVGYTARHHTFFEMLGNFSFGDYFKKDAIHFGWEFLTSPEWMGIPKDKLTVTVYADDDEAYGIWKDDIGVPADRIIRIGDNKGEKYASDNFWAMGDTGPCGPCTEIFYDHGEDIWGGPPGSPEEDGDRFIEIWNIVFMQYERSANGDMNKLPKPSVDTGMGLERIAAVMQGVHNNYDIDLFRNLLTAIAEVTGQKDLSNQSLRVIADHIRSCAFLVVDGVEPSNLGRGYVLRRIMRRAIRHGHKLGCEDFFFYKLVSPLVREMGDAYPELKEKQAYVEKVLLAEEKQFAKTLSNGMKILEQELKELKGDVISGDTVFLLHGTYGFPTDLTNDIARERGLSIDLERFDELLKEEQGRGRESGSFDIDYTQAIKLDGETDFTGYQQLKAPVIVKALYQGDTEVEMLSADQEGVIVLESTPFYAESGGQAGDTGYLSSSTSRVEVRDVTKISGHHLHHVFVLGGEVKKGDQLDAEVNASVRQATALNHSATHLLHAALRKVLGSHVSQKGSLNDSRRLRFDFSHSEAVNHDQLVSIEDMVNEQIRQNTIVETDITDMDSAIEKGALALFGEKYGDEVRVLSMGDGFSVELCGGTHVTRTGDIGLFRIVAESGIASGVRRIEAVTGQNAIEHDRLTEQRLATVSQLLKSSEDRVADKLEQFLANQKKMEKELQQLKAKLATAGGGDLASSAKDVNGVKVLAARIDGVDRKSLLSTLDQMKQKLGSAVILLASEDEKGIALVSGVTADLTGKIKAGDLMKDAAGKLGGKGGGRPDSAQGGGTDISALPGVLETLPQWVEERL